MKPNTANETLTAGVTDWTTSLSEYYKVAQQQRNEHQTAINAVGQQSIAKAQSENVAKLVDLTTSFYGQAKKAKKAWWDDPKNKEALNTFNTLSRDQITYLKLNHQAETLELGREDQQYLKRLDDLNLEDSLREEVDALSGSTQNRLKQFLIKDTLANSTLGNFEAALGGLPELKSEYDAAIASGDIHEQSRIYRKWVNNNLIQNHGVISKKLFAASASDEIDRMVSTLFTASKSSKNTQLNTTRQFEFVNQKLLPNLRSLTTADQNDSALFAAQEATIAEIDARVHKFVDIPGGLTARQQATASVVADIYKAAKSGFITRDSLDALFSPTPVLMDEDGKPIHGSGKLDIPGAFFADKGETETHLFKALDEFDKEQSELYELGVKSNLEKAKDLWAKGELTDEKRKELLNPYINGVPWNTELNNQLTTFLEKKLPTASEIQSEAVRFKNQINNFTLLNMSDADIEEAYSSGQFITELKKRRDHLLGLMKSTGYVNDDEVYTSNQVIKGTLAKTLNVNNISGNVNSLPTDALGVYNEILQKRREIFFKLYQQNPEDPLLGSRTEDELNKWLDSVGFNDDPSRSPQGRLSPSVKGGFPNHDWVFQQEQKIEGNKFIFDEDHPKLVKHVNDAFKNVNQNIAGETQLDKVLNTPGSILDIKDIVAAKERLTNGQSFSSEVILAARLLKITPLELLERSTAAYENDSDSQDENELLKEYGLKSSFFGSEEIVNREQELIEIAKEYSPDILTLLKTKGIENLSPNQFQRLRNLLSAESEFQAQDFDAKQAEKEAAELDAFRAQRKEEARLHNARIKQTQINEGITDIDEGRRGKFQSGAAPVKGNWQPIGGDDSGYMVYDGKKWVRKARPGSGRPDLEYFDPINQ